MNKVLVTGAGGFIGHHLVTYLKERGFWVRGVDLKYPEYTSIDADEFEILDLRRWDACLQAMRESGTPFLPNIDASVMRGLNPACCTKPSSAVASLFGGNADGPMSCACGYHSVINPCGNRTVTSTVRS